LPFIPSTSYAENNAIRKIKEAKMIVEFAKKLGIEYEEE